MTSLDAVRAAWADLLGAVPHPDDDFFGQGGDSLRLLTLADRLREILHREVPAHRLLANPTPAGMAAALDEVDSPAVAGHRAVPTSRWQSQALELARDGTVPAAYAFSLTGTGSPPDGLDIAMRALVSRHTALRTYFPTPLVARLAAPSELDCPIEIVERPLTELLAPFDPTEPPLFRAVVQVRGDGYTLGFAASDLIMDAWSVPPFVDGLTALTDSSDFTAFAAAERKRLDEPLALGLGAPAAAPDEQERVLAPETVDRIGWFGRRHRVTPFSVLVAATLPVLGDSRVLLRLANRDAPHLIGPYQTFASLGVSLERHWDLARTAQYVRDADLRRSCDMPRLSIGLLPRPRPSRLGEFAWLATGRVPTPASLTWIPTGSGAALRLSYPGEWASQLNTLLSTLAFP